MILAEHGKAPDHPPLPLPQTQGNEQGDEHNGNEVPQNHPHGKSRHETAHQDAHGNGDDAGQYAFGQSRPVLGIQNAQGNGNGKHHSRSQHGAHQKTAQLGGLRAPGQFLGQGSASHIVG